MKRKAYINGVEVSLEFAGMYHEVISKVNLGAKLTPKERSFYLLMIATAEQAKEFIENERKRKSI